MSTKGIYIEAPAKINLYLRVIGRRPDGYHLLATLMQKLSLYDRLEIEKTAGCEVNLECPDSDLPVNDENIVLRAALLFHSSLQDRLPDNFGVRIILRKKIPVAAGLGGGSSDAAAMLIGLDRLFRTGCSKQELARLGLQLGADVPFFIYDRPVAWATGIGEELTEAQGLEDGSVLLVNPGFPVSTKWVYENLPLTLKQKDFNLTDSHSQRDDCRVKNPFRRSFFGNRDVLNDLELVTEGSFKEISLIKEQLLAAGAGSALMSGSGPTVFGIFSKIERAQACYLEMLKRYSQTFLVSPLPNGSEVFDGKM